MRELSYRFAERMLYAVSIMVAYAQIGIYDARGESSNLIKKLSSRMTILKRSLDFCIKPIIAASLVDMSSFCACRKLGKARIR